MGPEESDCVTVGTLASLFCKAWGDGLKWKNVCEDGPHEAKFLKLDCSHIKYALGWKPCWDIRTAIEKLWNGRGYMQRMGISAHAWRHRSTSF